MIDRVGPADIIRRLFDLKGDDRPQQISPVIHGVAEMRAVRPWEFFDEGIRRWSLAVTVGPGGAGTFAVVQVGPFLGATLPKGNLYVVTAIQATVGLQGAKVAGDVVECRRGATTEAGLADARSMDSRIGIATVSVGDFCRSGTPAAVTGTPLHWLTAGQVGDPFWYVFDRNAQAISFFNSTANQQLTITLELWEILEKGS